MRRGPATLLLLAAGTAIVSAAAHSVIEQRQEAMKAMAGSAKTIGEMFQGKRPYDAATFEAAAELIASRSGKPMLEAFPAGSTGFGSDAAEKIWADWNEFAILAERLSALGTALAADAAGSPDAIGNDMRMKPGAMAGGSLLGGRRTPLSEAEIASQPAEHVYHLMLETCTSCHAKFRVRRK